MGALVSDPASLLFATHPELLAPVLQIVHRVIAPFLIRQAALQRTEAHTGAVTLMRAIRGTPPAGVLRTSHFAPDKMVIQRFGSAANLNIHLYCLVLDGVYRTIEGAPVFHAVCAPTAGELQALLNRIIKRLMRLLTRQGIS